ncbi:hydantoinase B/oxoprolinase family protein [uncultured Maribacter sp.]|uniref:hydantoinase B/oxoprolinase family protein n=1 Tax=uncultured Maribacter sp. TaxID=431308 RepID=UPI00262DE2C0|nr:hydantoinase B/oxoprolinase family protein [uncultured Maribacter sp.]
MQTKTTFDPIALSILWSRLISIVDEAGTTLQRTSFSTVTRESNDFAVVLMDRKGRSIAQSSVSVPSFLGVLPMLTKALLADYFPLDSWKEGDVVMTNDPWLCAGHKPDIGIVSPIFYEGNLIGFIGTIAHSPDMGGVLWGAGSRDLYEEGLMVPPTKLISQGKPNHTLFNILEHNVRASDQTIGDIRAQIAANDQGIKSLMKLMEENNLGDLQNLADAVINASEKAMREALLAAPDGSYQYAYDTDGDGKGNGCHFEITVTIKGDEIHADYEGTSGAHPLSINAVLNYTYAYTAYPIKCTFSPDVPNNDGSFYPIKVTAPKGCLVNAQKPSPLGARNITGNMLHSVVFGALAKAVPEQVQADCGSACWCIVLNGEHKGKEFVEYFFLNGGYGARPTMDGEHVLSFPTNVANVPIEVLETDIAVLVTEKSLVPNSGGEGKFRGGLGQRFSFKNVGENALNISLLTEKTQTPAKGILLGQDGQMGAMKIIPHRDFPPKGLDKLHPGEELILTLPGGGGYGDPAQRDKVLMEEDKALGYIN